MQQWSSEGVRQERTGWRCEKISERHRHWGYNCPAVDLDFVVAEYNHGKPVALVEYKERHALKPKLEHPTYMALKTLADGFCEGALPFMLVFYDSVDWWFRVTPINSAALNHYRHCIDMPLTEQRFVTSLYLLRKQVLDENDKAAIARLSNILPDNDE